MVPSVVKNKILLDFEGIIRFSHCAVRICLSWGFRSERGFAVDVQYMPMQMLTQQCVYVKVKAHTANVHEVWIRLNVLIRQWGVGTVVDC